MSRAQATAAFVERGGPPLELLESKLSPPNRLGGIVPRSALVDRLEAERAAPIILVSAPPGYGKTTMLEQWASRSSRPFAWVSLDQHDNDPVVLLSYVAAAVDRVRPLDPAVFEALAAVDASIEGTVVPRLASALAAIDTDFVLVLDDTQTIANVQCRDAIDVLADHLPSGSRLVLSGQIEPARRLARLRARGLVLEIGPDDLRMGAGDADELLRAAGAALPESERAELVERAEGWPAGLYLAALSIRAGAPVAAFHGDDRLVADYLREELLARLPATQLRFLMRTSVLERMSPPLCDSVLGAGGSADILESLERSNLFVVPLDQNREWYRYHHLFREMLRAELERMEPSHVGELLVRASDWSAAHGEPQVAVGYAQEAGDTDRVAALIATQSQDQYRRGRAVTVEGWLGWLDEQDALERYPEIAVMGSWFSAIRGQPGNAERWAAAGELGALGPASGERRRFVEAWLAVLRAAHGRRGVTIMEEDANAAASAFGRASRWWATAAFLHGLSYRLGGDDDRADDLFADVADAALATEGWGAASLALAERAILAIERDEWDTGERLADQALSVARRSRMEEYPPNAVVHAVCARVAAHRGARPRAEAHLAKASRARPGLTHVLGALSIQTRLELAATYLALGDTAGARTLLREADRLFRRARDFGTLHAQADDLRAKLESARIDAPGASTLTAAELRLLPFLPTHLSFREIGDRLYVSRYTVKSQAVSIYRKLSVSSRTAAVERTRELGLL